jgi:hypothetical protein
MQIRRIIVRSCVITSYPDENTIGKGNLTTRTEPPEEPAVTLLPERGLKSKTNTPKGTFRKLQERGIKITNYHERGWRTLLAESPEDTRFPMTLQYNGKI